VSHVVLVQPRPGERISGGYLYNAQMARHGAWQICDVDPEGLAARLPALDAGLLIADSIWLTEGAFGPFFDAAARGQRVAALMHSFPSFIAAAEGGGAPPAGPSGFEIEALERLGLVIAPGRHYADLLAGHDVEVLIAEPGVGDGWRLEPRPRRGPCSIVTVGAVTPRKGQLDVLEALRPRARDPNFRFTMVGSLRADERYADAVAELMQEFVGVTLAGQMSPEQTCELVKAADVLAMPSYDENQPLVLLEAMAASVPAVAYAAGATAHMIGHGREGLVCPIGDRDALGRSLGRLIDDEGERWRMALACWERQRTLPDWATAARRVREALEAQGLARAEGRRSRPGGGAAGPA
jgi:glycosyltransferase involved in cell wall biosynthesis